MKKMNEKPGHVRPANDFYAKLNALMFVPQKELSGDQAYWLSANEIASQASKSATPGTPFVRKSRPPSQVLASLRKVNAVFPQLEGIIKERTTQKPDYVSDWCFDYAKQFVEQQLVPFYDHFKNHIQTANDTFFKEIREFEQIFDELEAEYEQCVLDNKNLTIEKKNLLIINECLIAEYLEKDICSIVPLIGSCDQQALETDRIQLKDTITSLRIQLDGLKVENVSLKRRYDELSKANTHSRTAYTEKLSAFTAENTKLKAQVTSGPSTSETPKVLAHRIVLLSETPRPSLKPTQKPVVHPNKQSNVCVPMSTGVKPTSGASKTVPKRAPRNHSSLPVKSANARKVEAHHRTLNKKNRVDSNLLVKHSVSVSKMNNQSHRGKPTGRHFSLFEKHPLTRIMDSTDQPIELPPSASSSPKITMVSRFADHKLSDRQAGSKGISAHQLLAKQKLFHEVMVMASSVESSEFRDIERIDSEKSSQADQRERKVSTKEVCFGNKWMIHRFGWVRFLRTKDETPQVIEKFIVKTQRALNATVRFVRTDNGTETTLSKDGTELLWKLLVLCSSLRAPRPMAEAVATISLCYPTNDYDDVGKLKAKADIGLAPQQMTSVPNSTELELNCLLRTHVSALVKDPKPPSVPPTKKQVDDLFQWFDDDEAVPIPLVVPTTPVNVPAAPAPEIANGSPSTTVISEGGPACYENSYSSNTYQTPSDSELNTV
ncbi:hypothetical protein Tco_0289920 [Tanacetum coccineum]